MEDFENQSKEELIKLLNDQLIKHLKKKATLKEIFTSDSLKDEDTLFITSAGFLIGKPYNEGSKLTSPYIILSDVILIKPYMPLCTHIFNDVAFHLAIDQIIAYTTIDRELFLSEMQSQQHS